MDAGRGKVKWSNFHITVNFNVDSEEHVGRLRRAVEEMSEPDYLWRWLKRYDGTGQVDFDEETRDLVDSVRIRCALEHGGQQNHGLHAHLLLEVGHSTLVQVNKRGLEDLMRHFVGLTPNVHIRFMRGDANDRDYILHYITKEVPRAVPADPANNSLRNAFGRRGEVIAEVDNELPL